MAPSRSPSLDSHPPDYLQPDSRSSTPPAIAMSTLSFGPASTILPPPVTSLVSSRLASPTRPNIPKPSIQRSPLVQLQNTANRLHRELQDLLNTHANALLAPARKGPSIQQARTSLLTAMSSLSDTKARESELYADLAAEREQRAKILGRQLKKAGRLRDELRKIEDSKDAKIAEDLRKDSEACRAEVEELRRKLREKEVVLEEKMRHVRDAEEKVELNCKSWRVELEKVQSTMARGVEEGVREEQGIITSRKGKRKAVVPSEEPEEAAERWTKDAEELVERGKEAEKEVTALDAGMDLWEEVVEIVDGFEAGMRTKLAERATSPSQEQEGVVRKLESVIGELEALLKRAEVENWKLLEVSIGVELQAFREGRELVLRSMGENPQRAPSEDWKEEQKDHGDDEASEHDERWKETSDEESGSEHKAFSNPPKIVKEDMLGLGEDEETVTTGTIRKSMRPRVADYSPLDD